LTATPNISIDLARKLLELENGDVVKILTRLQIGVREEFISDYSPYNINSTTNAFASSMVKGVEIAVGTRTKRSLSK